MELTELRYFYNVATTRSFSKGAKLSYVTPPAISKAIKKLEDDLDAQLFVRTTRRVNLTDRGEILLNHCRTVFEQIDAIRRDLDDADGNIRGEVRIGANEVFSAFLLPTALSKIVREHPGLVPHSYEMIPSQIEHGLSEGTLDLGFTLGEAQRDDIVTKLVDTSPGVLVCGAGHPLYEKGVVTPEDLLTHPSVVPEFFGRDYLPSLDQFPVHRYKRRVGATVELMQMRVQMAVDGVYLGYYPEVSIRCQLRHGELKVLEGIEPGRPFELRAAYRAGTEPRAAIQMVIDRLRQTIIDSRLISCA
jgi:DNA-binding transcriptional LysR family regulator